MTDQHTSKPYAVEVTVAAGRDRAWAAVTQPELLRQWFGWDYDELDVEIQHIFVNEATLQAPEQMGWADGSYLAVTGDDERATVRVAREGSRSGDPDRYDAIEEGWRSFLIQLRHFLDERPAGPRRTLYLTGTTTGGRALKAVGGEPVRAGKRVAWLVDRDGHLVVVAGQEPLDSPDTGPVEVTVSTYGLDDAAFDVLRKRWTERWSRVARDARVTTADTPAP
ncbi:activator of HSP90 ATPase [Couchioplanes caeruleus]|uniref:SRPBCC family protein n=1 Tax=Couchioplanes caeruleus TaxID=56438 RepID=UPI0020C02B9F|nr:activator of HSP90 ATPase [Couchioplanes caeruleus]UQU63825.1 activator of HSP90 ATPase [Couchioplanes caeruleus]